MTTIIDGVEMTYKETIFQSAEGGIPAHYAVQYYVKGKFFPEARYFDVTDEEGVKRFEKELGVIQ